MEHIWEELMSVIRAVHIFLSVMIVGCWTMLRNLFMKLYLSNERTIRL